VESYKTAVRSGVDALAFWSLTPYQVRCAMGGLEQGRVILAWQIAALNRYKKLPTLDKLLAKKKSTADLKQFLSGFKRGGNG
jgi:hypothetical protein